MKLVKNWRNKEERYKGLRMLIELAWEHEWQFANLEKQHKRTRIEHLLIESHNRNFQRVENDIETARLARRLWLEEEEDEKNWVRDNNTVETEVETIPWWVKDIKIIEEGDSSPSQ
jgi:hypothetical protein